MQLLLLLLFISFFLENIIPFSASEGFFAYRQCSLQITRLRIVQGLQIIKGMNEWLCSNRRQYFQYVAIFSKYKYIHNRRKYAHTLLSLSLSFFSFTRKLMIHGKLINTIQILMDDNIFIISEENNMFDMNFVFLLIFSKIVCHYYLYI